MDNIISVKQAAEILGVSPRRVRQFIQEGRLKSSKVGGHHFLQELEVRKFAQIERRDGNPDWRKK
jgi:excisionase family DNA binding protein